VHRDLKPENIHVEPRGDAPEVIKVIDFGIVKIERGSTIDDGKELTSAGHMIGTYDYMSPEQIVGSPCRDLSDIYSLGVVLYEMLTGRRPFTQVSGPASMMAALLTQTPAPPSVLAAIPRELDRIVMRCLEREPAERFGDIRELAGALDRLLTLRQPQREEVTIECPAYDPTRTERFTSPCEDPSATLYDEERTWIDLETRTMPDPDRPGTVSDARTTRRIATGTAPAAARPPAPHTPPAIAGANLLYSTLPGIAVAATPTPRNSFPAQPGPPLAYPRASLGWQPLQAQSWLPAPALPQAMPPGSPAPAPRASSPCQRPTSDPGQLLARSYGVLWLAIVLGCVAALVAAAV